MRAARQAGMRLVGATTARRLVAQGQGWHGVQSQDWRGKKGLSRSGLMSGAPMDS